MIDALKYIQKNWAGTKVKIYYEYFLNNNPKMEVCYRWDGEIKQ